MSFPYITELTVNGSVVTAPTGYYPDKLTGTVSEGTYTASINSIVSTGYLTVTAIAHITSSGYLGTGNAIASIQIISRSTLATSITTAFYTVYASSGYFHESTYHKIPRQTVFSVVNNVVTAYTGYYSNDVSSAIGTAKAATTITPGTTAQTVAAGTYLTGTLTVAGNANLKAANIASNVTIFGVTGTANVVTTNLDTVNF